MSSIGERLVEERKRLGYNQTVFGAIGGVLKQAQLKYEKGERSPDAEYLAAIANAGADVQYILTGTSGSIAHHLASDEQLLVDSYRLLSPAKKKIVLAELILGSAGQKPSKSAGSIVVSGVGNKAAGRDIRE